MMTGVSPHKISKAGELRGDDGWIEEQAQHEDKFCCCMSVELELQFIMLENGF